MRLIDADEVLKKWGLKFYAMGGDRLGPNGDEISFYVNGLLNEIQNAPTVEPKLSDEQIEQIADLLETEWGYEGIREDVSRILRGGKQ